MEINYKNLSLLLSCLLIILCGLLTVVYFQDYKNLDSQDMKAPESFTSTIIIPEKDLETESSDPVSSDQKVIYQYFDIGDRKYLTSYKGIPYFLQWDRDLVRDDFEKAGNDINYFGSRRPLNLIYTKDKKDHVVKQLPIKYLFGMYELPCEMPDYLSDPYNPLGEKFTEICNGLSDKEVLYVQARGMTDDSNMYIINLESGEVKILRD